MEMIKTDKDLHHDLSDVVNLSPPACETCLAVEFISLHSEINHVSFFKTRIL